MMGLVLADFFKSVTFIRARKEGTLLEVLHVRKGSWCKAIGVDFISPKLTCLQCRYLSESKPRCLCSQ